MKHNWNFFQNESADAEKKALLPVLVIPLVVIVLMIVIVLADYGKKRTEESAAVTETAETQEQEPETMAETGESAETETDAEAEAETEASEENGDPYTTENLTHDSVPEVLSLMKKYFTARASGDADTMNEIYGVSGLSFTELEHEKTRLRSNSKYVQDFENITTYVRDGVTADSWLVYALADIKFHSVKTAAPMIMWCYVEKDSEGNFHIINDTDLSENVLQFVETSNHSEEVRKLASSVNVKLKEALNSDEDLNSVYGVLRDGSPVYDDTAVLNRWLDVTEKDKNSRSATFYNTLPLHDGNHYPGVSKTADYKARAQKFFDELDAFFTELEKSGRKVMVVVVPEHGGALKGDRMQVSGLRDIPSPSITDVPVGVKFFGMKAPHQGAPIVIDQPSSFLAISDLVVRVLDGKIFTEDNVDWKKLTSGLPQTAPVSENSNAVVIQYQDKPYVRLNGGDWVPYPQ